MRISPPCTRKLLIEALADRARFAELKKLHEAKVGDKLLARH